MKWSDWASQYDGASPPPPAAPPAQPAPQQPVLAPPPPGYAWGFDPGVRAYVLIPLQPSAPPQAPTYTPPAMGYHPNPPAPANHPGQVVPFPPGGRRAETCMIVREGDRDPYADLLDTVPELFPQGPGLQFDAMRGEPAPGGEPVPEARAAAAPAEGYAVRPAAKTPGLQK